MLLFLVSVTVFFAVFTQSISGFGVALVSMALLSQLIGIQLTTPLVALVSLSLEVLLLIRYRSKVNIKAVWQVSLASVVGIPLGLFLFKYVKESLVLTILGLVIVVYALYMLLNPKLPQLLHANWAYGFGLVAGMLGGAYNTAGPPVVIYGDCQRWLPAEFKGNLQGFFVFNSTFILLGHALAQNLTPQVWSLYFLTLPALGLGILAGLYLDNYINPILFRKLVLCLLLVLGLVMIF